MTLMMKNVVSCALYDVRVPCDEAMVPIELPIRRLIAVLSVSREQLDFGNWKVVGHQPVAADPELWPNEEYRGEGWVGAKVYDATIAEELLDAYNGLLPWDDWHDPEYLDRLLVSRDRKPKHLMYKKR